MDKGKATCDVLLTPCFLLQEKEEDYRAKGFIDFAIERQFTQGEDKCHSTNTY